jgi:hypothetical protein
MEEVARTGTGGVDGDEEGEGQPAHPHTSRAADGRPPARWVGGFSLALTPSLSSSTPQTYALAPTQLMFICLCYY